MEKKIALITGSATRIGAKIATHLAKKKYSIVIHYNKSDENALQLYNELSQISECYLIKKDLSKEQEIESLIPAINEKFGLVRLLINNAAYFKNDDISSINNQVLNDHLKINLSAPLILSKNITKQDPRLKANIINILDCSIASTTHQFLSYKISKSALAYATRSMALALSPNIRVNGICPGPTLIAKGESENHFNNISSKTPLGYSSTIEEICSTLDFILKIKSITGQLFFLDGGANLMNQLDF